MKAQASLLSLLIISVPSFAQLADQSGISGEIALNAGYISSESQFDTDNTRTLNSLDQSASSENKAVFMPFGKVAYTFGPGLNQQFYAGTSRDDIAVGTLAFELGYQHLLESGTVVDISWLPTILSGETWADPFQTGSDRQETNESGQAYRLTLGNIAGSPFSFDMAYGTKDIEDEHSGHTLAGLSPEEIASLNRDADTFYIKGDYRYRLDTTSAIIPSFSYTSSSAEGDAYSFAGYGVELTYFKKLQRHQLALTAGYTTRDYDHGHAVFANTTRADDEYSLFAAYEYDNFMDWKNWSFISLAGYDSSDSNIDFYDEQSWLVSMGLNYQF